MVSLMHAWKNTQQLAVTLFGLAVDLDAQVMIRFDLSRLDDTSLDVPPANLSKDELQRLPRRTVELSDIHLSNLNEGLSNEALVEFGIINQGHL